MSRYIFQMGHEDVLEPHQITWVDGTPVPEAKFLNVPYQYKKEKP
jgi:hypothetical protein